MKLLGWIILSYKQDINHEYIYEVYEDGRIISGLNVDDKTFFVKELADENLHMVKFIRNSQ